MFFYDLLSCTIAVYMLDIFMDSHRIELWRLHLVAITSVWLAAKVDEITCMIPSIQHLNTGKTKTKFAFSNLNKI